LVYIAVYTVIFLLLQIFEGIISQKFSNFDIFKNW